MKAKLTPLFSKFTADDVKEHYSEDANVFIGIGKSLDFGSTPDDVEEVVFTTNKNNQLYRNLVGLKKVVGADMQTVIARRDWASDIVYDAYRDDIDIYTFEKLTEIGTVNANANTTIPGTVSFLSFGQPTVTGIGTEFTKYLFVGDQIRANSEIKTVLQITNDTSIIVNSNFTNAATGVPITLVANNTTIVTNSENFIGNVFTGNTIVVGNDTREVVTVRSDKVLAVNSNLTISLANTTLSRKDNTYPLYATDFYVRNSRDQVFKCLFNNERANSTVEPTIDIDGQLPENPFILTSDGYRWKYLYSIAPGLKQKFFTNVWMPVANDNAVIASTLDGRVDIINVLWGGSGHIGGGSSNTARILSIISTDGTGANLSCKVNGGVITEVNILNGGQNYTRGTVTVIDNEKLGNTTLVGTVNVSGTSVTGNLSNLTFFAGNVFVNDLITVNNETRNVVSVINNTSLSINTAFNSPVTAGIATIQRSDATFDIEFSPPGGHGFFPARELGARSLMISTEIEGNENGTIPISSTIDNKFSFNQISIIDDPLVSSGAFFANAINYRVSTRVFVSNPGVSNFTNGETVFVGTSLENATFVANVAHWSAGDNYLFINNLTGTFSSSQLIRGATSGTSAVVLEIANSDIKLYSGEILYVENRQNITRDDDQIEQVKIVLTF